MKKEKKKSKDKYRRVKDKWIKATEKWLKILWCNDFAITWYFDTIPDEENGRDGFLPIASVVTKPQYFETILTADPVQLATLSDADLDTKACHEIMHVVLSPYNEWAEQAMRTMDKKEILGYREYESFANECVTSRLTQIVRRLYKNSAASCCHKHDPKQKTPRAKKS